MNLSSDDPSPMEKIWEQWYANHACPICGSQDLQSDANLFCVIHYPLWLNSTPRDEVSDPLKFIQEKKIEWESQFLCNSPWIAKMANLEESNLDEE